MARARKVKEETALQAALASFWQHGFGALGTRQLEAETGITRFTLQTAYGGKMALFLRALDAYLDRMETELIPAMDDGSVEGLARWFEMRATGQGLPPQARFGCMMIAAVNEFGPTEPDIALRNDRFQQMLRSGFRTTLERLRTDGALDPALDINAAVEVLMAATVGLNVVVRGAGECAAGTPVAQGVAQLVRGWRA